MSVRLIDTNVLIDAAVESSPWQIWSMAALQQALAEDGAAVNPVIVCELAMNYQRSEDLERAYPPTLFRRLDLPWAACSLAGQAHLRYRQGGGRRDRTLPDFLIGAHAQVAGLTLVTRDATRYRSYFPDLALVEPGTHFKELAAR